MKHTLPLSFIVLFSFCAFGQNVGVGTSTPQLKLDVAGAIGSTPGSAAAANSVVIPNNLSIFRLTATAGAQTNTLSIAAPQNGQYLTIINDDGDAATFGGFTIPAGSSADFIYMGAPVSAWKRTSSSPYTAGTGVTITNNTINSTWTQTGNDIYNNNSGNVGIGTGGAPSVKLHVSGNGGMARLQGTDHAYLEYYPDGPATRKAWVGYGGASDDNFSITNENANANINLNTNGTGRVYVSSLGTGMVKSTAGVMSNAVAGTDYQAPMSAGTGISISSNTINSVWTQTGNDIYNNNSGNVGIGTGGAASQKLQIDNGNVLVRGVGNFTGDAIYYMGDANHFMKSTAGDGVTIGTFGVATGIKLKQSSGNVGIGDANPLQKLNVVLGTGTAEGNKFRLSGAASTDFMNAYIDGAGSGELRFVGWSNGWNINQMTANKQLYINRDAPTSSNVWIGTSGREVYVRGSDGNTGIGTSSPNQKLDIGVNGGLGFSGPGLNSADKKLYAPADGDLEWMTHNSAGAHGFAVSHQGTKAVYLNTSGNSYLNGGNVGVGTSSPQSLLHVMGKLNIHQSGAGGGQNRFEGVNAPTDANGRGLLVISSSYSDLVIASSQANDAHGSTLTFATYNPANAADYRKFVINQGNWGARRQFLDFGYADAARINPHSNINSTDNVMTMNGINKSVGIGTYTPENTLEVNYNAGSGANRSTVSIVGPGNAQWGNILTLRTTGTGGGTDGASIVFRSRDVKNWIVGGETNGNGFQIREDGGDARFGSGFGTIRVHVAPGGQFQTRNGLLTERRYNYFSKRIPTNGTSSQYNIGNWDYCASAGHKLEIGDDAFDGGSDNTRFISECWVELNDTWPLLGCDCDQPWGWDYGYDSRPSWQLYMYAWCQFDGHMRQHCMAVCVNFDY